MVSPDIGNMIATKVTVSSRVAPENPGAAKAVMAGASAIPARAATAVSTTSSEAITPESFLAPSSSHRSIIPA